MKEALSSYETLVLSRATWRNIPGETILRSHRRENLKSYTPSLCSSLIVRDICRFLVYFNIDKAIQRLLVSYLTLNPKMEVIGSIETFVSFLHPLQC
jgi:hypothetical protein